MQNNTDESRRWDESGGHNGRTGTKKTVPYAFPAQALGSLRFHANHVHERCTSSLSYLLAAASLIPARRGRDALPNTATKQKSPLNSGCNQKGSPRTLRWRSSRRNGKPTHSGSLIQARAVKRAGANARTDSGSLCICCVRCRKEAIRGNESASLEISARSELIITKPFFSAFPSLSRRSKAPLPPSTVPSGEPAVRSPFLHCFPLNLQAFSLHHCLEPAPLCLCHFCLRLAEALAIGI